MPDDPNLFDRRRNMSFQPRHQRSASCTRKRPSSIQGVGAEAAAIGIGRLTAGATLTIEPGDFFRPGLRTIAIPPLAARCGDWRCRRSYFG